MMHLTLKQLRYFKTLAETGHFGRAADLCAISQPALSMQIKELEENLGSALIERGPRSLRLTRFGQDVAKHGAEILRAVEELGEMARAAQERPLARLRLGVIPTIAPYLLPQLIGALAEARPGLDLHLRESLTATLLDELLSGQIDAAIVALPISESSLAEYPLFSEEFVLVRPQAEAQQPAPDAAALATMRLLLLEEGHCFRDQALSFCDLRRPLARGSLDGSTLSTLVQMVGAGIGVTLIPQMAVKVETRSAPVAVARFAAPRPSRHIGMIWRKSNPLAPHLADLAATLRAADLAPMPLAD
ncbi:MAG: LysR substrate-binding domain-containing protein [Mangrovicoccus sp.]|nr:LysR substrate-binding domain-containing protein [Mangrovicoccus sp.]